jgi:hypothetical protein
VPSRRGLSPGVLGIALLLLTASGGASPAPVGEITKISGQVYRLPPTYAGGGPREWFPLDVEGMSRLVQPNLRPN